MKIVNLIILSSVISFNLIGCSNSEEVQIIQDNQAIVNNSAKANVINNKNVDQVKEIFDKNDKDTVFIDVREPIEWAEGVIPNAKKISLANLPNELPNLDKTKNYVLVCRSGNRSSKAYKQMEEAGFLNLTNFNGGMLDWYSKKYPIKK